MQPCEQHEKINELEKAQSALTFKQDKFMEILSEVREDVKEIKKFIFEGGMAKNYVTREMFDKTVEIFEIKLQEREEQIRKLERNQNKVAWLIVSAVLIAIISLVIIPKVI